MGFKMKNPAMAKLVKMAGDPRVALKMAKDPAMKMAKDPAMKMAKDPAMNKLKDLSGDGKVTQKDVLIGRGVIDPPNKKAHSHAKKADPAMKKAKTHAKKAKTHAKKAKTHAKKTYREAYDGLSATQKAKYSGYSDFLKQAKEYNMKKYGTTEPTKAGYDITTGKKRSSGGPTPGGSKSGGTTTKTTTTNKPGGRTTDTTKTKDDAGNKTTTKTTTDSAGKVVKEKTVTKDAETGTKTKTTTKNTSTRQDNLQKFRAAKAKYKDAVKAWREGGKQGPKPERPKRRDFMRA
tara:strand:- start:28 stop:897 length:870 start_codon:yes stop_codon:yes gene_type:complete